MDWAASALPTEGEQAAQPRAIDVLRDDVPRCRLDERTRAVRARVEQTKWHLAVVVNDLGVVLGLLRRDALDRDADEVVERVMEPGPRTIRPSLALRDIGAHITNDRDSLLVTTPDGVLLGVLTAPAPERSLG